MQTTVRRILYKHVFLFYSLMLALAPASPAYSEPAMDTEALTSEAVGLISRLQRLERQLLYPAYTHVSVFLSVAGNSSIGPLSVSLEIDNSRVTDHIYSEKETTALNAGGIQRLYTGNVLTGEHRLRVSLKHAREDGSVRTHKLEYEFAKDESAEHIEIIFDNERPQIVGQSRG